MKRGPTITSLLPPPPSLHLLPAVGTDPSSNLTHIQEVSDWILNAKLPLSPADLRIKLEELRNLAKNLPDSSSVLRDAAPQLAAAKKLLEEARAAR